MKAIYSLIGALLLINLAVALTRPVTAQVPGGARGYYDFATQQCETTCTQFTSLLVRDATIVNKSGATVQLSDNSSCTTSDGDLDDNDAFETDGNIANLNQLFCIATSSAKVLDIHAIR